MPPAALAGFLAGWIFEFCWITIINIIILSYRTYIYINASFSILVPDSWGTMNNNKKKIDFALMGGKE